WDKIQPPGPLAANTVPGVVDAWFRLHQRYGRLDWKELFQPALQYARNGFPISQKFADYITHYAETLRQFDSTSMIYLAGGRPPRAGTIFRQLDLANSIELIANQGAEVFYRGELAKMIIRGLQNAGGLLTENDFASHSSDWVDTVKGNYRGYEVHELPPNTQGIATLLILNILDGINLQQIGEGTADYYHLMTEAVKLAFADRDEWVTDAEATQIPYERLFSNKYSERRRNSIDMQRARPIAEVQPGFRTGKTGTRALQPGRVEAMAHAGDTVYMCAVDPDGQAVSLIQSVYFEFGSAFISPGTGILLQNRGSFFSLNPEDTNALAPKKRTFHTIIPALAERNGKAELLFGTMGGEGQPQTQTALITRIADFGFNVQEAVEAPRWLYGRTWGEESKSLKLEARIPDGVINELSRRGHDVQVVEHWSQKMGHAQAIRIDRKEGVLHGAADPRGEGIAIGW
ncbi:MAG: gamma-glutamyltransferase, partial [Dehalococcoidales bacterium]|nr:gamma-glutamyltransferase [Dehalococcoidales bacterium]